MQWQQGGCSPCRTSAFSFLLLSRALSSTVSAAFTRFDFPTCVQQSALLFYSYFLSVCTGNAEQTKKKKKPEASTTTNTRTDFVCKRIEELPRAGGSLSTYRKQALLQGRTAPEIDRKQEAANVPCQALKEVSAALRSANSTCSTPFMSRGFTHAEGLCRQPASIQTGPCSLLRCTPDLWTWELEAASLALIGACAC